MFFYRKDNDINIYIEQRAIEAMCAVATIGNIFESQIVLDNKSCIYDWLETLLASNNTTVNLN